MFKSNSRLQHWYDKYNKLYFDGELPECQVGWSDQLEGCHLAGQSIQYIDEDSGHEHHVIAISSKIAEIDFAFVQMVLLHECAHIKLIKSCGYAKHGKKFEEEMLRLAMRGAMKGIW